MRAPLVEHASGDQKAVRRKLSRIPLTFWFAMRAQFSLFCPLTSRGKQWIEEHVQPDAQWFGSALVVEHRFAWGLAQGLKDAGLVLA
jgi:squalene cyclase